MSSRDGEKVRGDKGGKMGRVGGEGYGEGIPEQD